MAGVRRSLVSFWDGLLSSAQCVESSLGWSKAFNGGLVPVAPVQNVKLIVKSGEFPKDLSGAHLRVGPNPQHWPPQKRMHVFDGDGMVHVVRFESGSATYHCDFLETPRFKFEQELGKEWFVRLGEFSGKAGLLKILTMAKKKVDMAGLRDWETTTANTAIGFTPHGKLWALNEVGPPFQFALDKAGVPKSIGLDTMGGLLEKPMSAHPKFDRRTGDIFFHGKQAAKKVFFAGRIKDGVLCDCLELPMRSGFQHDMFITENYAVVIDGSTAMEPKNLVKGGPLWKFNPESKLRFGIYPRSSEKMSAEAFHWIEADFAAEIVHTLYAYDEDDKITLFSPLAYHDASKDEIGILGGMGKLMMRRIVLDVGAGTVSIEDVAAGGINEGESTEFPRVRDDRTGYRAKFGYSGLQNVVGEDTEFNFTGILKWNLEESTQVGTIRFPEGLIGGEPVFCPRGASLSDDDGYVCSYLWNPQTQESSFVLYDAQSFSNTPVAELAIPRRVPLGFHALWITEKEFQAQLMQSNL